MSAAPLPPLTAIPPDVVAVADYLRRAPAHLPAATWAWLDGGAADEITLAANLAAWRAIELWPRAFARVAGGHTRVELFGDELAHPFVLAPVASQTLAHPDGETASLLAAGVMGGAAVVASQSAIPLETLAAQPHGPLWFQLYWQGTREATLALIRRAEAAGCRALVLTADAPVSGVRNRAQRAGFVVPPAAGNGGPVVLPPLTEHQSAVFDGFMAVAPGWEDVAWLTASSALPVLLKGILHPDDARRALDAGVAGLIVSNHGGRALDGAPSSVAALPGVLQAAGGRVPVLVDGGIRRGADALKARALGADAVLIGRPYVCALAVAGALGVAHLLRLLREELEIAMALTGHATLAEIDMSALYRAAPPH